MSSRSILSEKGLTLIELLVVLAVSSIVSTMLFSNLIGGMNSFRSVTKQISLHDEANYVMSQFVNQIFVATKVEIIDPSPGHSIIRVTNHDGVQTTLGFENNQAVMNNAAMLPAGFSIDCQTSKISVDNHNSIVSISMVIQDQNGRNLVMKNDVSFVKVVN
jgi:prepilin-type N-terminal cleavage/methylation domain-containing protein